MIAICGKTFVMMILITKTGAVEFIVRKKVVRTRHNRYMHDVFAKNAGHMCVAYE